MNDMKTKGLYEEYKVDISAFTQERPLGVSGILRCRNCADYIEACIESCIGALDELVIVFHDCTDNTPQILRAKQAQYSTKIKTFFFKLSEQTYFEKYVTPSSIPGNRRMIETMRYSKEILDGGFCWFHLRPTMPTQRERCNKMYEKQPDRFTTLEKLKENTYRKFHNYYHPFIAVRFAEPIFSYFYTASRKHIPWNKLKDLEK